MSHATAPTASAVIQGANRGIGLALAQALASNPAYDRVIATCRAPDLATDLLRLRERSEGRLDIIALDVTDEASIRAAAAAAAARTRRVALLINCAGVLHTADFGPERRLEEIDPGRLQQVFAVNAFGPLLVAKHFSPLFDRNARTVLANLSARVGSIGDNALGGWYGYRASKAAQNMFTRNLSIELRRKYRKIICVALHPGTVDTELSRPFQRRVPAHKLFSSERAAAQLLEVIDGLGHDDNGHFYAWDGSGIVW